MRRSRLLFTLAIAAATVIAISIGGNAFATGNDDASASKKRAVTCTLEVKRGKRVALCPRGPLRGKRGRRGARGPAGPPGPAGAAAPGSGLNLNFNAQLTANKTNELRIGNFTITAASNGAGNCEPIRLRSGVIPSRVAVGAGGDFVGMASSSSRDITNGANTNMFTAVSENGGSTMSGIVGAVSAGGVCLVSGYVTGL